MFLSKKEKTSNNKEEKVKSKKKMPLPLKIFLIILLILVILLASAFGAAYFYVNSKLDKINYVDLRPEEIYIDEEVKKDLEEYRNIALLGIDAREDTFEIGNRTDCIMIVSINQRTGDVKIASVYRDTYLDIEGHGLDKVTHAYAYGGPKLALNTLNKNLDLNITEFVAINFETVHTVVDAVGGITIPVDAQEVKYINTYINELNRQFKTSSKNITTPGTYTLDGVQALAYSRIRYTEGGDYKRTERMRDVLTAVFNKAKTRSVTELNSMADTILPHITTNIDKNEILGMIPQITKFNVGENFGWPYEVQGITLDRWYGVPVELASNVSKLHAQLFGKQDYVPSQTVQDISQRIVTKTGYKNN